MERGCCNHSDEHVKIAVIGGGAAGCYYAIHARQKNPQNEIHLFESSDKLLRKVLVSGGGRCNITHSCFDPDELIKYYPRGQRELKGIFYRYGPSDVVSWFESVGVPTKTQDDGRIFPVSDRSKDVVNCLMEHLDKNKIQVYFKSTLVDMSALENKIQLTFKNHDALDFDQVVIASGGINSKMIEMVEGMGHTIVPPVPSLFTFKVEDRQLTDLSGISCDHAKITLSPGYFSNDLKNANDAKQTLQKKKKINSKRNSKNKIFSKGSLLITHEGLSGPAILKASALFAREFAQSDYKATICIDFLPDINKHEIGVAINEFKKKHSKKSPSTLSPFPQIKKRLWQYFLGLLPTPEPANWSTFTNQEIEETINYLKEFGIQINGRSVNKDEFVTCGGVSCKEIDFKNMESKIVKGLFFVGEVIDIDGLTGGFNFQNAWSTAWVASQSKVEGEA